MCHACSIGGNADLFLQDPCDLSGQEPLRLSIVIILENIELTTKRKVLKRNIYCQVNIVLFYRFIAPRTHFDRVASTLWTSDEWKNVAPKIRRLLGRRGFLPMQSRA